MNKEPEPEEEEYGPDNPPPAPKVPPAPPKRRCARCNHLFLFSEILEYAVSRGNQLYDQIMHLYKGHKWYETMLIRIQKDVEVQKVK